MKRILGTLLFIMIISVSTAKEIRFSPDVWSIGKWCISATDIIIDTQKQEISATDIIIESNMEFVDFVPTSLFPYFLPSKTDGNIIHIVGFTTDPAHRVNASGSIWTLYMQQKNDSDSDGSLRLYFTHPWDTTDSNLSIAWGIDVLDSVGSAFYTFDGATACTHSAAEIKWGISDMTIKDMADKITRDHKTYTILIWKLLGWLTGVLIMSIVAFIYYRKYTRWNKM